MRRGRMWKVFGEKLKWDREAHYIEEKEIREQIGVVCMNGRILFGSHLMKIGAIVLVFGLLFWWWWWSSCNRDGTIDVGEWGWRREDEDVAKANLWIWIYPLGNTSSTNKSLTISLALLVLPMLGFSNGAHWCLCEECVRASGKWEFSLGPFFFVLLLRPTVNAEAQEGRTERMAWSLRIITLGD